MQFAAALLERTPLIYHQMLHNENEDCSITSCISVVYIACRHHCYFPKIQLIMKRYINSIVFHYPILRLW